MNKSVRSLMIFLVIAAICVPSLILFAGCYETVDIDGVCYRLFGSYAEVVCFYFNEDYPFDAQVCVVPAEVEYEGEIYPVTAIGDGFHGLQRLVTDNGYASELVLPETVEEIRFEDYHPYSFRCLTKYTVDENNQVYTSIDGVLFNKSCDTLLHYPRRNSAESFTLPKQTNEISKYCEIWDNELLRGINVEEGNETFASSDGVLFTQDFTSMLLYPQGRQLDTFKLPKQMVTIFEQSGFWSNKHLKNIDVEEGSLHYKSEENVLYSYDGCELVFRPRSEQKYFAIPSTVSVVACNALPDVDYLFVPKSVTLFMDSFVAGDFSVFAISNIYFEGDTLPNYVTVNNFAKNKVYTNATLDSFNALFSI